MLEVSLGRLGTLRRLERDSWSMVKCLRQATNEYPPRPLPQSPLFCCCRRKVWDEVYGFDMSVIKEIALTEPLVDVVEGKVRYIAVRHGAV